MNTNRNLYLGMGVLAIGLIVAFAVFWPRGKTYSWRERLSRNVGDPYGVKLLFETLEQSASPQQALQVVDDSLKNKLPLTSSPSNYLFIGGGIFLDSINEDHLVQYIAKGNTALLVLRAFPYQFLEHFIPESCTEEGWIEEGLFRDTVAHCFLKEGAVLQDQNYRIRQVRKKRVVYREWTYLKDYYNYCSEWYSMEVLGNLGEERVNFFVLEHGAGKLLIHLTPLAFTNYQFIKPEGRDYVAAVLDYLGEGPIYWDDYNQIEAALARGLNQGGGSSRKSFNQQGPLQYILSEPALAWAWYLTLAAGLLFLLFRAKRRQRVIPVLAENKNTSLEFIQMISQLYLSQKDHRKLALQKMRLWKNYLRDRYQIHLKDQPDEKEIEALAAKTGTSVDLIQEILDRYQSIYRSLQIKDLRLQEFHQVLNTFYQTSK